MDTLIPNFSYDDETNLLCLLQLGIAHTKELAVQNDYWIRRVEDFEKISAKLNSEVRNYYAIKQND